MKKVKIIITLTMICAAAFSSAFAKRFHPASVYYKPLGASTYTLIQCTLTQTSGLCSYQQTRNNAYFANNGASYVPIPNTVGLYVPNAK
jgi:hypothetical protein